MSKRKHKLILLFIGSYAVAVFVLSLHLVHRSYGVNETEVVYVQGNTYKVVRHKPKLRWCQPLKLIENTTNRPVVALVSFAGSGNTWLRYLLQQATGILTGSAYKDYSLLWNGLYGESITNSSVSVVKTHEWGTAARENFDKAVLLIRSPGPAIQAEFNRRSGGHLGYASIDRFTRNNGKEWTSFLLDKLESWRSMNLDWIHNFQKSMLVIFYEELVAQPNKNVESVTRFLELLVDVNNLQCMMRRKEGIYRRRKPFLPFDPFPPEVKAILDKQQKIVYDAVVKRNNRTDIRN